MALNLARHVKGNKKDRYTGSKIKGKVGPLTKEARAPKQRTRKKAEVLSILFASVFTYKISLQTYQATESIEKIKAKEI